MVSKIDNVLSWATQVEPEALQQANRVGRLPFVEGHIALMADAHVGYGTTVGSVIPTRGAVIPYAIGVDIGCGMIAAELPFTSDALGDDLKKLHARIAQSIPSGMGKGHQEGSGHNLQAQRRYMPHLYDTAAELSPKQEAKAYTQFGTLGSGNHFIEVCLDERDVVWVVLHSGSRGIGHELATMHIARAKGLMKQYFIHLEDPNLAYLTEGTPEFDAYITDMLWAQAYALGNREAMMDSVLRQIAGWIGYEFKVTQRVNCHHNYTEMENHHGKNMWITRKGAIRARKGDYGIIPGSMGTATYIVEGKGDPSSYCSASHGAGRMMSRTKAKQNISAGDFETLMDGIMWNNDSEALLDEAPPAYKDIHEVMSAQEDLVEVKHVLKQILNYKGT